VSYSALSTLNLNQSSSESMFRVPLLFIAVGTGSIDKNQDGYHVDNRL